MKRQLNVLIAEDELLIRIGIKLSCDWGKLGMRVVDDVADGISAWEAYQRSNPDILLIDIRMSGMNGVELVEKIRNEHGNNTCRIIIITCVEEFAILHRLTHYGITDYLLKVDMTPETLNIALQKARQEWEQLNVERIIDNIPPKPQSDSELQFTPKSIMTLCSEQFNNESQMVLTTLNQMLCEQIPDPIRCIFKEKGIVLALLGSQSIDNVYFQEKLGRVQVHFQRIFGLPLSVLGTSLRADESVEKAFLRIYKIYDKGYWFSDSVARWEPDVDWLQAQKEENRRFFQLHVEYIDGISQSVHTVLEQRIPLLPVDNIAEWQNALVGLTSDILLRILRLESADIGHVTTSLFAAPTAYASLEVCLQLVEQQVYQNHTVQVHRPEIRQALDYMNRHFSKNLSCTEVADLVGLSPRYFLSVFKKETGMTFVSYLNHYRVEQAKALLENTSLYAYEIALRCGFSDAAYFSRTFKQITGVHPSYHRQSGNGGQE